MSHTIAEKGKLLARVRRIQGQMSAVERALENEAECAQILQLVASVRGAVGGLTFELIEHHIRHHLAGPQADRAAGVGDGAQDLIDVLRTYLK